jgi:ATP-binding cassette subfamily B protein
MAAPVRRKTTLLKVLGRALGLVWQASPSYVLASVPISLIQGLLPATGLYITKLLLDEVVRVIQAQGAQPHALSHLLALLALQAAAGLVGTGLGTLQNYLESSQGERLSNAIQRKILVKASEMGLSSFEDGVFYDQLQRAYQEAGNRPLQIIGQLRGIVQSSITTASFIALLIHLSPWVLLILVASALPSFLVQTRYGHLNYWMLRHRVPEVRKQSYFSYILRTDCLIKELKLFNLEGHFIGHFDTLFKKFFAQTRKLYRQRSWASLIAAVLSSLGTLGALLFVALAVVAGRLSVGDFGMYTGVVAQFRGQVSSILSSVATSTAMPCFSPTSLSSWRCRVPGSTRGRCGASQLPVSNSSTSASVIRAASASSCEMSASAWIGGRPSP